MDNARENPLAAAAAVGGAVAAGVFLWSRRNQISDQISSLSDQIGEWRDSWSSGDQSTEQENTTDEALVARSPSRRSRKTQREIAEEALTLKETGTAS